MGKLTLKFIAVLLAVLSVFITSCRNQRLTREATSYRGSIIYNKNATSFLKNLELTVGNLDDIDINLVDKFNPRLTTNGGMVLKVKMSDLFSSFSITNPIKINQNAAESDSVKLDNKKLAAYNFYKEQQKKIFPDKNYRLELLPVVQDESLRVDVQYEDFVQSLIILLNGSYTQRSNAINFIEQSIASYYRTNSDDVDIRIKLKIASSQVMPQGFSNFSLSESDVIWTSINLLKEADTGGDLVFRDAFVNYDNSAQPLSVSIIEASYSLNKSDRFFASNSKQQQYYLPIRRDTIGYSRFKLKKGLEHVSSAELKLLAFDSLEEHLEHLAKQGKLSFQPDQRKYLIRVFPVKGYVLQQIGFWEDVRIQIEDIYVASEYLMMKVNVFGNYANSRSYGKPNPVIYTKILSKDYPSEVNSFRYRTEKLINGLINK